MRYMLAILMLGFIIGCATTPVIVSDPNNWEVLVIIPDGPKQPFVWVAGNSKPLTKGSLYQGWRIKEVGYDYINVTKNEVQQRVELSERGKSWRSPGTKK